MKLRKWLDKTEKFFLKGGPLERYAALYEALDTFLYSVNYKTIHPPHIRAAVDNKRVMTYVVILTLPALLVGLYNTGLQINLSIANHNITAPLGWRATIVSVIGFSPSNFFSCFLWGLLYFLPVYITTLVVGGIWEVLFAVVRKHEINEGFLVSSILFAMTLPPAIPLWQVALGISFGVVVGKEIFGGVGKNFLNPALVGRAFLYFSYPASMSGDTVWIPLQFIQNNVVAAVSSPTALSVAASQHYSQLNQLGFSWFDAFFGLIPGSMAETSTIAILLSAIVLVYTRIANFRLVLGCLLGLISTSLLFNLVGSDTNPMFAMPWHWHLVLGGFAFGLVFMVTEPVSAAHTNLGRWVYAFLIGFMCVFIRVLNPAFPEGMMLAILFGNIFAPIIDYTVVKIHIRNTKTRHAKLS